MKIPLMIKQYLAVGIVGALVGAAGVVQLNPDGGLLGAADGSWLRELQGAADNKPKISRLGEKNKKGGKKAKRAADAPEAIVPPNINLDTESPTADSFAINREEIERLQNSIKEIAKTTLLDKPNPEQCAKHLIDGNTTIAAIGEVRSASIYPSGVANATSCYVSVLPKGCTEMATFKASEGFSDAVSNFCNAILSSASTGADVIAIGSKTGGLPGLHHVPHLVQFDVYSKGHFARAIQDARNTD